MNMLRIVAEGIGWSVVAMFIFGAFGIGDFTLRFSIGGFTSRSGPAEPAKKIKPLEWENGHPKPPPRLFSPTFESQPNSLTLD